MLNERNNQITYQNLLEQQESIKNKKQIKNKVFQLMKKELLAYLAEKSKTKIYIRPYARWFWLY